MRNIVVIVCSLMLLLGGCANTAPQTLADDQTAQHLLHDAPPHGYTRLYLFDGRFVNGSSEGAIAAHFRADELIDGVNVGSLNGGDVLVVDVPAGTHTLVWQERSSKAPISKVLTVNLRSGQRVFVSNDYQMHSSDSNYGGAVAAAPFMAFGAVGGAIGGAIYGATTDSTTDEPAAFMTVRSNGEEMTQNYDVVLPNQSAVEQLRLRTK